MKPVRLVDTSTDIRSIDCIINITVTVKCKTLQLLRHKNKSLDGVRAIIKGHPFLGISLVKFMYVVFIACQVEL